MNRRVALATAGATIAAWSPALARADTETRFEARLTRTGAAKTLLGGSGDFRMRVGEVRLEVEASATLPVHVRHAWVRITRPSTKGVLVDNAPMALSIVPGISATFSFERRSDHGQAVPEIKEGDLCQILQMVGHPASKKVVLSGTFQQKV